MILIASHLMQTGIQLLRNVAIAQRSKITLGFYSLFKIISFRGFFFIWYKWEFSYTRMFQFHRVRKHPWVTLHELFVNHYIFADFYSPGPVFFLSDKNGNSTVRFKVSAAFLSLGRYRGIPKVKSVNSLLKRTPGLIF